MMYSHMVEAAWFWWVILEELVENVSLLLPDMCFYRWDLFIYLFINVSPYFWC